MTQLTEAATLALAVVFYAPVGALALALLGLLWAPLGALILAAVARLRGFAPGPCAAAGAKMSALMFLPWVYLFVKLAFGRPPPGLVVKAAYATVYAVWMSVVIGNAAWLANYVYYLMTFQERSIELGTLGVLLFGTMLGMNVYTFRLSMKRALEKSKALEDTASRKSDSDDSLMSDKVYLAPFGWLIGWAIGFLFTIQIMLFAGFVADVSS